MVARIKLLFELALKLTPLHLAPRRAAAGTVSGSASLLFARMTLRPAECCLQMRRVSVAAFGIELDRLFEYLN